MILSPQSRILIDDAVERAVLDLIREAKEYVQLVSPYNDFWEHLKDAIHDALQRGVKVTLVYRQGEQKPENKNPIDWLLEAGGHAHEVRKLHAKIYLSESSLLITSMNLLDSSSKNSKEVGVRIADLKEREELLSYVKKLIDRGKPVNSTRASAGRNRSTSSRTSLPGTTGRRPALAQPKAVKATGHCIRCGKDIALNSKKPLCPTDYKQWEKYQRGNYPEKYCHRCGRGAHNNLRQATLSPLLHGHLVSNASSFRRQQHVARQAPRAAAVVNLPAARQSLAGPI